MAYLGRQPKVLIEIDDVDAGTATFGQKVMRVLPLGLHVVKVAAPGQVKTYQVNLKADMRLDADAP